MVFGFMLFTRVWVESKVEYTEVINEFKGYKFFSKINGLTLAVIYTIGHFAIAITVLMLIANVSFMIALTDAIVEPLANAVWYFILDKIWTAKYKK